MVRPQIYLQTMHPKDLAIADFRYDLPQERIAKYPLPKRDESKLLVYRDQQISEDTYSQVAAHLPANSFLVFNNTKVVEARLLFQKPTGGVIEVFCLEPHEQYADITTAMLTKEKVWWKCLIGGASKWKPGMVLLKPVGDMILEAAIVERNAGAFTVELRWNDPGLSFAEVLHRAGAIPLPPYLHREAEETDKERYQTVYAAAEGSVAAPTAGLHFTKEIFKDLSNRGIQTGFVTLHVGAGTFKPVKSEKMADHDMHAEFIDVSLDFLKQLQAQLSNTVVAVGTTSLRTLESLYWIGVQAAAQQLNLEEADVAVSQWYPYESNQSLSASEAIQSLISWMQQRNMQRLITRTQIIIAPGYELKIASGIITNFHQPESTLLLLIAAIVGDDWKRIYRYAMEHGFRFLSYGDGSLLWKR